MSLSCRLHRGVEIDKNLARLRTFSRDLKYRVAREYQRCARPLSIAKSQPALQQGSRSAFLLTNDLETFLHQFLVFLCNIFLRSGSPTGAFPASRYRTPVHLVRTRTLPVRGSRRLSPTHLGRGLAAMCLAGDKSMSPWPSNLIGAIFIKNHATVDFARDLESDPTRDVRLDHAR